MSWSRFDPVDSFDLFESAARAINTYEGTVLENTINTPRGTLSVTLTAIVGTLRVILQQSFDYDPTAPLSATWSDTAIVGTATDPIAAVGDGSYEATVATELGPYLRGKAIVAGGACTFGATYVPGNRKHTETG